VSTEVAAGTPLVKGTAGASVGFHYGYRYSITATDTTYYAGNVGTIISPADWTEHRFDFGLYVRTMSLAGQKFPVIGYWVD
jgi:hypothetical protein